MPSAFKFRAKKCHLTYKTHISKEKVLELLETKGMTPKYYSIVHEVGDENEDNPTPYAHTHVALMWLKAPEKAGADLFDIDEIHPNVQIRNSMRWMQHLFTTYHAGHKTKADGKKYFIAPIGLWQEGPPNWESDIWDAIAACKSLKEGCEMIDALPKSISDVKLIQGIGVKRKLAEVEEDCEAPFADPPADWNPKKQSLMIVGKPGCGKTNWARNYFAGSGAQINDLEDLKHVTQHATGLIFDDQEYANMKLVTQKMVTDVTQGASIRTRHSNSYKPHLPAIFTCNSMLTCLDLSDGAVARRVYVWEVDWDMF